MSRRDDIRGALVTALGAIDGTGSYETTPREVLPYARTIDSAKIPAIHVIAWDEEREWRGYRAANATLTFQVAAYSKKESIESRTDELEKLVADIERAVAADTTVGLASYGVYFQIISLEMTPAIDGQEFGQVIVTLTTPYRFERGTP